MLSDCVWQTSKVEYTLETKTELRFEVEQGAFVQLEVRQASEQNKVRSYVVVVFEYFSQLMSCSTGALPRASGVS